MFVKEGVSTLRLARNQMGYPVQVMSGFCFVQADDYFTQRKVDKKPIRDIK